MDTDQNSKNHFYELVKKIQPLSQDLRERELANLSSKVDRQDTQNIKPTIASFQDASSKILKIQDSLSNKSEINDRIEELNEKVPKINQFFSSNTELIKKMQQSKVKRDFCRSLSIFSTLPNEILKEVKNHNYQLATKYLISMMKFFSDPKYNCPLINSIKQQFSNDYIKELTKYVDPDMFFHIDEDKFTHQSVQAVGFQISLLYYNIAEINNPSPINNIESISDSIIETLNSYFISWRNSLLNEKSLEIFNQFVKAGQTLFVIDTDIKDYVLTLPYLNLEQNKKLRNDIISISKKFYLSIYNQYVNFSQFDGYFYKRREIFDVNQITAFDKQDNFTKIINENWGKLVPKVMSMNCIVLLNCIIDLKEQCQTLDQKTINLFELLKKFYNLKVLLLRLQEKNDLPDFNFLKTLFSNYHSYFVFRPFSETNIKGAFLAFIYFGLLFQAIPATAEIREIIISNFSTRIVSALSDCIITCFLKSSSLTQVFSQIEIILKYIYVDYTENPQTKEDKTIIDYLQIDIRKSNINFNSILNLIIFQALNGITNYYLWESLDKSQLQKIREQELIIAEWYLNLLRKDTKQAQNIIKPYMNLLISRVAGEN